MIAEIGLIALILAALFSIVLGILPVFGVLTANYTWIKSATKLVQGQFIFFSIAFASLITVFCANDFSVVYVAQHSSMALPLHYKIGAVWGGHEGSLLLWVFILSCWTTAVAYNYNKLPTASFTIMLAILGWIALGFSIIILFSSNPFLRNLPFAATEGNDLNPLLQDFAMMIHPPILYMGYVGFAIPFAFALTALFTQEFSSVTIKWLRPWLLIAWIFLTMGIALGSWWAYYELGWGGWWFWDPVENASFMPWLIGTALIHSLSLTEKRGIFKNWTILLALSAFAFTVLGTFLVRSGVLSSVHSFASDPARGMFILTYLTIVSVGSLLLFALKPLTDNQDVSFSGLSCETMLLANNWLLVICAFVILFGTLFPIIAEALNLGSISVGAPYFNSLFIPLILATAFFLGLGVLLPWVKSPSAKLKQQIKWLLVTSVAIGIALVWKINKYDFIYQGLASMAIIWVIGCCLVDIHNKIKKQNIMQGLKALKLSYWGMQIAHIGFAVSLIGGLFTSTFSTHKDVVLTVGETVALGNYQFKFKSLKVKSEVNYLTNYATIDVYKKNKHIAELNPEKRLYNNKIPGTETAIDAGIWRDLYIAMGEAIDDDNTWSLRIQIKAMIRWLWLGAILMALGGFMSIIGRRYLLATKNNTAILSSVSLEDIKRC